MIEFIAHNSRAIFGIFGDVVNNCVGLGLKKRLGTEPGAGLRHLERDTHDKGFSLNFENLSTL